MTHPPQPRLNFAANLSMLFGEHDFLERFAAAAEAGFRGVEFLFPYDVDAAEIRDRAQAAGTEIVLFNLAPGDWAAGERGLAALPGREADFEAAARQAFDYAAALGCTRLHAMAGIPGSDIAPERGRATFIDNLRRAVAEAARHGVTLLIEPINQRDMPGYALSHMAEAHAIIEAVASDRLRLQFDLYHRQIMEGDLITGLETYWPLIGHIQIANPPDRSAPDDGEINYPAIFDYLVARGYGGWIGCEYRPKRTTTDTLGWRDTWR